MKGSFSVCWVQAVAGKTTLLNILAGFVKPTGERFLIDRQELTRPNPRYVTVFQEYGLFPWRIVIGNVNFGLEINRLEKEKQNQIAQ